MDDARASTWSSGSPRRPAAARLTLTGPRARSGLDRIAGLAARLVGSAASQVSLLSDVQTVVGGAGLAAGSVGTHGPLEDSLCTVTADLGAPLVVTDATSDARVAHLPPVTGGVVGAYLGVPLRSAGGEAVGALCVYDPEPRQWSPSDVSLMEELASGVVAELELAAVSTEFEASQVFLGLSVQAAGIGTFDLDVATGELKMSETACALAGVDVAGFTGTAQEVYDRIHSEDLPDVRASVEHAITTGGGYRAEYRVLTSGGGHRWIAARGRVLTSASGGASRLLGAIYDITALREANERIRRALESLAVGYLSMDDQWRTTYANAEAEQLLRSPRAQLVGGVLWDLFPSTTGTDFEAGCRRAVETGEPQTFDAYYPAPLEAWYEVRATPQDAGVALYFFDITERRRAQERAELLGAVTSELTGTLDAEEAVARLAQLVVPALSDWCVISLVADEGGTSARRGLRDVGGWHADPAMRPVVEAYTGCRLEALTEESFLVQALVGDRPVALTEGATEAVCSVLAPGRAQDLIGQLQPESFVVLPLRGRGRTAGLLTLFNGAARNPLTAEELATALDIASRAGLALDNARLYRQQRDLAEGLQRSLLTEPPEPDHMQVVVRYSPAAEAAQVGGDWYDAFLQRDGATVLVIGDVVGHDTQAAAAMSQVRTLLRGLGAAGSLGPAELLSSVDEVMEALRTGTTATAVVARIEQSTSQRRRGTNTVRWSNAGHPPPMVISPDGTVTAMAPLSSDLLLGVLPAFQRHEDEMTVDRGTTVLLYTDGLVERRGQSLDVGLLRLQEVLEDLGSQEVGLDELCDEVLARMLPPRPEDDVALVAVRLHPQDRPRPPEAGPRALPDDVADEPEVLDQPG